MMHPLGPRDEILQVAKWSSQVAFLLKPPDELNSKITKIANIFQDNPDLLHDDKVMSSVINFTKGASSTKPLKAKWMAQACVTVEKGFLLIDLKSYISCFELPILLDSCPNNMGKYFINKKVLSFTKEGLNQVNQNDFWDFIQSRGVKKLVVQQADGKIGRFAEKTLELLCKKRPDPSIFLEKIKLILDDVEIEIPKAKLLSCGDFFEPLLMGRYTVSNVINLSGIIDEIKEVRITLNAFNAILTEIEGDKKPADTNEEDFKTAANYLQFTSSPVPKLPEGCLGLELFEKVGGKLTDFSYKQWRNWIRAIEEVPEGVIFGIDPGLSIDAMYSSIKNQINDTSSKRNLLIMVQWGEEATVPHLFVTTKSSFKKTWIQRNDPLKIRELVVTESLYFLQTGTCLFNEYIPGIM